MYLCVYIYTCMLRRKKMAAMLSHQNTGFQYCLLLLCLTSWTVLSDQQAVLQSCDTWRYADKACSLHSMSTLPMIMTSSDYRRIKQAMETYRINTTWLALRRRQLNDFQWLDCQNAPGFFLKQNWGETSNCAYLNTREHTLDGGMCSVEKGVVCQLKDCSECDVASCHRIKNGCYVASCTKFTWEAARAYCKSRGWDLAVLGSNDMELRKRMSTKWRENTCEFLWVGLRRQEWTYSGQSNMTSVYWARKEPALKGNCSVMRKTTEGFTWHAVDCQQNHASLCMASESENVSPINVLTTTGRHTPTPLAPSVKITTKSVTQVKIEQAWTLPLAVMTVVILVVTLASLAVACLMRKKWKDLQKRVSCLSQESPIVNRREVPDRDYAHYLPVELRKLLNQTEVEPDQEPSSPPPEPGPSGNQENNDEGIEISILPAKNTRTCKTKPLQENRNRDSIS